MRRFPKWGQFRIIKNATLALWLGADHGTFKPVMMRLIKNRCRGNAILHRQACQRQKPVIFGAELTKMVIDHGRPALAFINRQFITKHIKPATNHLPVNLVGIHPFKPPLRI